MIISDFGRLGKEPKMQYTDNGIAKTYLNVACDAGWGENKKTIWVGLTAWGAQAETVNKYLQKGSTIVFSAEVTDMTTYEKQDGTSAPALHAKLLTVKFVGNIAKQEAGTPFDKNETEFLPEEF